MQSSIPRRVFLKQAAGSALACGLLSELPISADAKQKAEKASGGQKWQIGCSTRPWDQFEYPVGLDAIAEAGYRSIGLMTCKSKTNLIISMDTQIEEAQRIGQEVKDRGMDIPLIFAGGFPADLSVDAGVEGLKKLIDNCAAAGGKTLMVVGTETQALFNVYCRIIAECCAYAAEKNVGLTLKPHGGLNANGPQCRKAIEKVGHKNFSLWYDPGNIFYYSDGTLDPVDDSATVDGIVTGMCVKDFLPPKNVFVTPGTGKVDFPKVLSRLIQGGFTHGPLIVETLTLGDRPKLLEEAKKAREFVQNLTQTK